jgi:hypothetical protein
LNWHAVEAGTGTSFFEVVESSWHVLLCSKLSADVALMDSSLAADVFSLSFTISFMAFTMTAVKLFFNPIY